MQQTHEMKLQSSSFDRMKVGDKTVEFRLDDEKRKLLAVGDQIIFRKLPDLQESLTVEIVSFTRGTSFGELFDRMEVQKKEGTKEAFVEGKRKYYSEDEEHEKGVVAIEIKLR